MVSLSKFGEIAINAHCEREKQQQFYTMEVLALSGTVFEMIQNVTVPDFCVQNGVRLRIGRVEQCEESIQRCRGAISLVTAPSILDISGVRRVRDV